jgi:hypothetical protein
MHITSPGDHMTRHILIFAACFLLGAAIMAAIRAAGHHAYDDHSEGGVPAQAAPMPMVPADMHASHVEPAPSGPPVNSICAICGMHVNPKLPTAVYQGKVIGFGCAVCPGKFAKEPDRYGPAALLNQIVEQ